MFKMFLILIYLFYYVLKTLFIVEKTIRFLTIIFLHTMCLLYLCKSEKLKIIFLR